MKWKDIIEKYNGKYKSLVTFENLSEENLNSNSNPNLNSNQKINVGSSPGARSYKGISYSLQRKTKINKDK